MTSKKRTWQWRHIILVLCALLATEQVRSAFSVQSYYTIIEPFSLAGEASVLLDTTQELMVSGATDEQVKRSFDALRERGLAYMVWRDPETGELLEVGERRAAPDLKDVLARGEIDRIGELRSKGIDDQDLAVVFRPESMSHDKLATHTFQIVEFTPRDTLGMRSQANFTFWFELLGALLTLVGGTSIWWLIDRRSKAQKEVQEQKTLATLGKMSAVISHELRNPLAAAMGQAELLEMLVEGDERAYQKAGQIKYELGRLETLSENLLNFINFRRIKRIMRPCALIVHDIRLLARDERLIIDHAEMPEDWNYDDVTLIRAIDNIVSNALSFTPDGETVLLTIRQEGDHLVFTVRDRGPGFPEGVDVFEPFVTTRIKGTGLGMAVASEVIRAHEGVILANNHPDGGAFVYMSIPSE